MSSGRSATARTIAVIEQVAVAEQAPTHAELARRTGIPKSTLSLILAELQSLGYVRSLPERRFVPGPALVGFSHRVQARSGVAGIRPVLEELATGSGEAAMFGIEVWPHIVLVEHVQAPRPIRYVAEVGSLRPMHCTAQGRAILAFTGRGAADLPSESLVSETPSSLVDPVAIDDELARTRARGYALNIGESLEGVGSIAMPVFDGRGRVIGAAAVSWLQYRVTDGEARFAEMLLRAARELGERSQVAPLRAAQGGRAS